MRMSSHVQRRWMDFCRKIINAVDGFLSMRNIACHRVLERR